MTPYAPNLISSVRKPQAALLELWSGLNLTLARAHEACGQFRRSFAMMVAQNTQGPVFWVAPEWSTDRLHPEGVTPFFSPGRLTFVNPKRAEDILWCVEEILRSSAVPLVVADLPGLPALTPIPSASGGRDGRARRRLCSAGSFAHPRHRRCTGCRKPLAHGPHPSSRYGPLATHPHTQPQRAPAPLAYDAARRALSAGPCLVKSRPNLAP